MTAPMPTYTCPNCAFGTLKPTRITYLRRWGDAIVTLPNFAAWQCDSCSYTRYDREALARLEMIFGPDIESLEETPLWRTRAAKGPDERGPHRWSY